METPLPGLPLLRFFRRVCYGRIRLLFQEEFEMNKKDLMVTTMFVVHTVACSLLAYASVVEANYYRTLCREWVLAKAQMVQENKANKSESDKD